MYSSCEQWKLTSWNEEWKIEIEMKILEWNMKEKLKWRMNRLNEDGIKVLIIKMREEITHIFIYTHMASQRLFAYY